MNFQKIVLSIAIIIFIILMLFIGATLYQNKYGVGFPPTVSQCPDYWIDKSNTIDSSNLDSTSSSDDVLANTKCYNTKNLGKSSCNKEMNFSGDFWQGSAGDCRKYKWAKGCELTWDGITNNSAVCDDSDTDN